MAKYGDYDYNAYRPLNSDGYVNTNGAGAPEVRPKDFNDIQWAQMHEINKMVVGDRLERDAILELDALRKRVAEQDQQLREEAWFCLACKSSFPKMLCRTSIQGTLQCPRCSNNTPGTVVRSVEAVRQTFQTMVAGLQSRVAELEAEATRLKEEIRKLRLRPGQGRVVEE